MSVEERKNIKKIKERENRNDREKMSVEKNIKNEKGKRRKCDNMKVKKKGIKERNKEKENQ